MNIQLNERTNQSLLQSPNLLSQRIVMPIFQGINSRTDKKNCRTATHKKKGGEQVYTGIHYIYDDRNKKRTTELHLSTVKIHNNNKFFR